MMLRDSAPQSRPRTRQEERFSPVFYEQWRGRNLALRRIEFRILSVTAGLFALASLPLAFGADTVLLTCITGSIALFALLVSLVGRFDRCRGNVLPFFERPLGGVDTFLAGTALLWNSRALDAIAERLGVTPLSAFASGDPVLHGEEQTLFDPGDALATTQALLRAPETPTLGGAVLADLDKLDHALAIAARNQVRFCLHLRTTNVASGHEMDLRNGSYF